MVRRGRDFDEDDVRVRANPRGSRPRTRQRPEHEDAAEAMVVGVDRGRYTCLILPQDARADRPAMADDREVTAMKARELGRKGVVVGDRVSIVGDLRGGPDSLARVVRVHPRKHVLRRTADDTDPDERVIVANADQLVIVTALADPEPRPRMIDRCLVAAFEAGLVPVLCLTKADLADPGPLLAAYSPLGVDAVVTEQDGDLTALRRLLSGQVSVLVGHSGVGKSTLVNALVPDADRAIGQVNDVTGRGRHTSTSAVALRMPPTRVIAAQTSSAPEAADAPPPENSAPASPASPASPAPKRRRKRANAVSDESWHQPILFDDQDLGRLLDRDAAPGTAPNTADGPSADGRQDTVELPGGWVIDTPGVRSFGLAHVSPDGVIAAFPDLAAVTAECPRGCTHAADAPDCNLDEWLASLPEGSSEKSVAAARIDSIRRLLSALTDRP
ncbi:MAG TPA: ribosome small subunit-dependent GTPase A [Actinocrinis sp.]